VRKLYRNPKEGKLFGVCEGLGDHFNIDPVLFRVLFIVMVFAGIFAYLLLAIIVPKAPKFL